MSVAFTSRARVTALLAAGLAAASLTVPGPASATSTSRSTAGLDTSATTPAADTKVADPATKVVQLLKQPDGFTFPARMTDLEVVGLFETKDGYGVERDD